MTIHVLSEGQLGLVQHPALGGGSFWIIRQTNPLTDQPEELRVCDLHMKLLVAKYQELTTPDQSGKKD